MPARIGPKELVIKGVGHPGQGVPVVVVVSGERPLDRFPLQSGLDVSIVRNVAIVINVGEGMMVHWIVKRDGCDDEEQAEEQCLLAGRVEETHASGGGNLLLRLQTDRTHPSSISRANYIRSLVLSRHRRGRAGA